MLFNSIDFVQFFIVFVVLYYGNTLWSINENPQYQNLLIFLASLLFYSFWGVEYLVLLIFIIILTYFSAYLIKNACSLNKKHIVLSLAVSFCILVLFFFKYSLFFYKQLFHNQSNSLIYSFLNSIVLPIGISFYIFHSISYLIDVYRDEKKYEPDFICLGIFISYFPLLVAGPIERSANLIPQLKRKRKFAFSSISGNLPLILWGFVKKIVVADNISQLIDQAFQSPSDKGGMYLIFIAFLFSIQIYCDFSGYSDIAMGISKTLGINLLENFNFPYFSINIREFWKRWHISLTSFFRDYLYKPIGGSRMGLLKTILNVLIIFLVSGFWHGANWTFIIWGLLHFVFFIPYLIPSFKNTIFQFERKFKIISYVLTFIIVCFAWVFFRSSNLSNAVLYLAEIVNFDSNYFDFKIDVFTVMVILIFILFESLSYIDKKCHNKSWILYLILILFLRSTTPVSFIYFQF